MLKFEAFAAALRREVLPAYVLAGEEPFLRAEAEGAVVRAVFGSEDPGPGLVALEGTVGGGAPIEPAAVLDEARSLPLFGGRKVVAVRRAAAAVKQHLGPYLAYLAEPEPLAVLVLHVERWDRRSAYARKLDRYAVDCSTPYETAFGQTDVSASSPLGRWLAGRAERAHGLRLAPGAVVRLIELVGANLGELDGALGRLAPARPAGSGARVTEEAVEKIVAPSRTQTQFRVADLAVAGRGAEAFAAADACFEQGLPDAKGRTRHGEPGIAESLIWAISRRLERLYAVRGLLEEKRFDREAAAGLGIPPFRAEAAEREAREVPLPVIARGIEAVFEAARAARGRVAPRFAVERLVLELSEIFARRPAAAGRSS